MTINSLNYHTVIDLVEEWYGIVHKIAFQFHTPFSKDDPLWLPFGDKRNKVIEKLVDLKKRYPKFVVNGEKQLSLMKGNWGGTGTTPVSVLRGLSCLSIISESKASLVALEALILKMD